MKILHVLSQFEVTGAEAYAVTLIAEQCRRGHTVFIVSDTLTFHCEGTYLPFPIGRRSYRQRIKNIRFLLRTISENRIDIVHAHSRAASWVCSVAARLARIPYVSTVHGRQHLHFSSTSFNVYGKHVVAISESLRAHLVDDLGIARDSITFVPNGFRFDRTPPSRSARPHRPVTTRGRQKPVLLFVGRLSGPKGDVVRFLLNEVLPPLSLRVPCAFQIVAGHLVPDDIPKLVQSTRQALGPDAAAIKEFQHEIEPFYRAADIVVGSGRVALEALALKIPTVGFGESQYLGLVTPELFDEAARSNFGDTGVSQAKDPRRIVDDLTSILQHPPQERQRSRLAQIVRERYDIRNVADRIETVYRAARIDTLSPATIPVLMYHRVVDRPPTDSRHGLWVTTSTFRAQMSSLQGRNLTPITFKDFEAFSRGHAGLPPKPVIMTFDDGYEDNYRNAFPVLREFGFHAVVFFVTGRSLRTNGWDGDEPQVPLLNRTQVREMVHAGIEFGSHTRTHAHLTAVTSDGLKKELRGSKDDLEKLAGEEVLSFAYPYGELNADVKRRVEEAGYKFAAATSSGPFRFGDDAFEIRRTQVFPWTDRFGFWKKTQPWYQRYKKLMT